MDPKLLIENLVSPLAAGYVAIAQIEMPPTATDAQIIAQAEGDLKHHLRQKIAWAVDILWSLSQFRALMDEEMAASLATNKAAGLTSGAAIVASASAPTPPAAAQFTPAAPQLTPPTPLTAPQHADTGGSGDANPLGQSQEGQP